MSADNVRIFTHITIRVVPTRVQVRVALFSPTIGYGLTRYRISIIQYKIKRLRENSHFFELRTRSSNYSTFW